MIRFRYVTVKGKRPADNPLPVCKEAVSCLRVSVEVLRVIYTIGLSGDWTEFMLSNWNRTMFIMSYRSCHHMEEFCQVSLPFI